MQDPWKHRSAGMKCRTCRWSVIKLTEAIADTTDKDASKLEAERGRLGRCRRHSPTMNGYPAIFENDWCGDHKLDENKI